MKQAIINGQVFNHETGNFDKKTILLEAEKIIDSIETNDIPSNFQIIDANNDFITPGLIDSFCQIGLKESGIRWEGDDSQEMDVFHNTSLSVIDGINPADFAFKDARAHGVTTVHIGHGPENVIGGNTAILKTVGTVVDQMVIRDQAGLAVSMGDIPKQAFFQRTKQPLTRMGIAAAIKTTLKKAFSDGYNGKPVFVRCHRADDILTALRIKRDLGINIFIVHGTEAISVLPYLKKANTAVFGGPIFQAKERYELKHITSEMYVSLFEEGIPFSFTTDHPVASIRYLMLEASLAVKAGLPKKAALNHLTLKPAELLGISDRTGSIAKGKDADLVFWNHDPLALTSRPHKTMINGRIVFELEGYHA